jgi:hypothetical protein
MGFGGPVWHASVANQLDIRPVQDLRILAESALRDVGDPALGEWQEIGERAVHIRRRLSQAECKLAGDLAVVDVRQTPEYGMRRAAMQRFLPPQLADWQED